jgi:predicted DNA-binding protein
MPDFEIALQDAAVDAPSESPNRLEPMLVRLPPVFATELRNLARRTRVRQSDYLREAVADLLAKYGQLPTAPDSSM